MGRTGKPVYLYGDKGEIVDSYPSVIATAKHYGVPQYLVYEWINGGGSVDGFRYSFSGDGLRKQEEPTAEKVAPWEVNGYFNINGWSQVCL